MTKSKDTKCPYTACNLGCISKTVHRARYAYMHSKWKKTVYELDAEVVERKSKYVNYERLKELNILYPLNEN